jgi:hypothetical protein
MCMQFTGNELSQTANELKFEIGRFLSRPTEPDGLLGNHPAAVLSSQKQSIAIWHGRRIEDHLSEWINRIPQWRAKARKKIAIQGTIHEIDNIAWNSQLNIVLAVEAKRVWANQPGVSQEKIKQCFATYSAASAQIAVQVRQPQNSDFRYFVFDVFGKTKQGIKGGLPIIAGDKIGNVFGRCIWNYLCWEKEVMKNALLEQIDPGNRNSDLERSLSQKITSDDPCISNGPAIIGFIDQHAR